MPDNEQQQNPQGGEQPQMSGQPGGGYGGGGFEPTVEETSGQVAPEGAAFDAGQGAEADDTRSPEDRGDNRLGSAGDPAEGKSSAADSSQASPGGGAL
ncbi:MAG TPA: hypothetical protein VD929_04860 [Caulobacteraceae bacterium]|nr:hypothetical protein [Caulobacteraceae bacterium]